MNMKLPNQKLLIVGSILLTILLFGALFFFLLYPKMQQIPLKEQELSSQQQLLSALQGNITNTNSNTFQSTVTLQKMVPVKPLSQQLLLDIEKAEIVSGSFVINMDFAVDGEVTDLSPAGEETGEDGTTPLEERIDDDLDPEKAEEVEQQIETLPLPIGVKKISVTLNVESPSYFELEEFIRILESSERITVIESIDFTAGEEIIDYEQTNKPLNYQLILSSFYMPTLTDLIDSLPKMETPEPAEKKNPFSNFGDLSRAGAVTKDSSEAATTTNSTENSETGDEISNETVSESMNEEHTVEVGENLTRIAKQYYQDDYKKGILKIKEANNMKSDVIRTGQVLLIPALD